MKVWIVWERDEDIGRDSAVPVSIHFDRTSAEAKLDDRRAEANGRMLRGQYALKAVEVEPPKRGWR